MTEHPTTTTQETDKQRHTYHQYQYQQHHQRPQASGDGRHVPNSKTKALVDELAKDFHDTVIGDLELAKIRKATEQLDAARQLQSQNQLQTAATNAGRYSNIGSNSPPANRRRISRGNLRRPQSSRYQTSGASEPPQRSNAVKQANRGAVPSTSHYLPAYFEALTGNNEPQSKSQSDLAGHQERARQRKRSSIADYTLEADSHHSNNHSDVDSDSAESTNVYNSMYNHDPSRPSMPEVYDDIPVDDGGSSSSSESSVDDGDGDEDEDEDGTRHSGSRGSSPAPHGQSTRHHQAQRTMRPQSPKHTGGPQQTSAVSKRGDPSDGVTDNQHRHPLQDSWTGNAATNAEHGLSAVGMELDMKKGPRRGQDAHEESASQRPLQRCSPTLLTSNMVQLPRWGGLPAQGKARTRRERRLSRGCATPALAHALSILAPNPNGSVSDYTSASEDEETLAKWHAQQQVLFATIFKHFSAPSNLSALPAKQGTHTAPKSASPSRQPAGPLYHLSGGDAMDDAEEEEGDVRGSEDVLPKQPVSSSHSPVESPQPRDTASASHNTQLARLHERADPRKAERVPSGRQRSGKHDGNGNGNGNGSLHRETSARVKSSGPQSQYQKNADHEHRHAQDHQLNGDGAEPEQTPQRAVGFVVDMTPDNFSKTQKKEDAKRRKLAHKQRLIAQRLRKMHANSFVDDEHLNTMVVPGDEDIASSLDHQYRQRIDGNSDSNSSRRGSVPNKVGGAQHRHNSLGSYGSEGELEHPNAQQGPVRQVQRQHSDEETAHRGHVGHVAEKTHKMKRKKKANEARQLKTQSQPSSRPSSYVQQFKTRVMQDRPKSHAVATDDTAHAANAAMELERVPPNRNGHAHHDTAMRARNHTQKFMETIQSGKEFVAEHGAELAQAQYGSNNVRAHRYAYSNYVQQHQQLQGQDDGGEGGDMFDFLSSGQQRPGSSRPQSQRSTAHANGSSSGKVVKLRSNVTICKNAIVSPACLGNGEINREKREKTLKAIARSDAKHLVIILRTPNHLKYRGVFAVDPDGETITKLSGAGPHTITKEMAARFFRYDSGARAFKPLPSSDFTVCDAVALHPSSWQKKDVSSVLY